MTYENYVYSTFRDFYEMENVEEIIAEVEFSKIERWINRQLEDGETLRKMYNMDYSEEVTVNCSVEENENISESNNAVITVDALMSFEDANQLVNQVGLDGFMKQFEEKYGYNFYSISNYWYNANDKNFACKIKGTKGDIIISW